MRWSSGDYQIAPLPPQGGKGRCARWAQDIIACDAAERIMFAVVTGSGSGKLCWHSRGNDNDQENAGYVRESAGGSEPVLRLRARDGEFRAPARVPFFFCKKKGTKENHLDLRSKDPLARCGSCRFGGMHSRMKCGGGRCRFGGSLVPLAPLPLTAVRVGVGALIVFGDYQIAPIAVQSTAMGRWRLTPPGYWGDTACGRETIPVGDKYYAYAAARRHLIRPLRGHLSPCGSVGSRV